MSRLSRFLTAAGMIATALLLAAWWFSVPAPLFTVPYSPAVYDAEGRLLSARVAADEQWRFEPGQELNGRYVAALLAFEDKRFLYHPGVDPLALLRAFRDNLRAGAVVSGGSTITMQVARMALGNERRTLLNKLREIFVALRLTVSHSKAELLSLYAGHAPFGGNIVGLEAAAWHYFGRPPAELSWAEASLLAVLPNNPSLLRLDRGRDALRERRDALLLRLAERGATSRRSAELALTEPLPGRPGPMPDEAPHLAARREATSGSRRSTLKSSLQSRSGSILDSHRERLANLGAGNAAVVIIDVESMQIIAYHGNFPADGGAAVSARYVDHAAARRSTGSLLKPFLFAAMIDAGELLPTQLVPDIPTFIGSYRPQNHTREYLGAVSATQALSDSLNVPTARMLRDFGVVRFYNVLQELGLSTLHRPPAEYGITLILGGAEASLRELTAEYAQAAHSVRNDSDSVPGASLWVPAGRAGAGEEAAGAASALQPGAGSPRERSPISAAAWWVTLNALEEVTRPGIDSMWRELDSLPPVSWKTGTSYGLRDAWAIGVTPEVAVGVWTGNSDGHGAAELRGSAAAGPLLFDLLRIFPESAGFPQPGGLTLMEVCEDSGYPALAACSERRWIQVPEAALAGPTSPYDRFVHLDESGRYQADARCAGEVGLQVRGRMVLPPAMEWFYQKRHTDYEPLPRLHPACSGGDRSRDAEAAGGGRADAAAHNGGQAEAAAHNGRRSGTGAGSAYSSRGSQLGIEYPRSGAALYVPVDFGGAQGRIVFQAYHRDRSARLFWHVDGDYLGETVEIHQMEARPGLGTHTLTVVDYAGNRESVRFKVLSE